MIIIILIKSIVIAIIIIIIIKQQLNNILPRNRATNVTRCKIHVSIWHNTLNRLLRCHHCKNSNVNRSRNVKSSCLHINRNAYKLTAWPALAKTAICLSLFSRNVKGQLLILLHFQKPSVGMATEFNVET